MVQALKRAGLTPVTKETRGEALRQRMLALQLDVSKLARKTGRERNTITRALKGEASETTLDQLEVWFDREERKLGMGGLELAPAHEERERRPPVSIRMEEGGTIVVEGPADTPEEAEVLKSIARDLMRELKGKRDTPDQ